MTSQEIVKIFEGMYNDKWGYVLGTAGEKWTEAKAKEKGGSKWIGHYVADCSGAFVYALKKGGISVYHGSNRLARIYTKQLLSIDERVPGMIAFKGKLPGTEGYGLPNEYKVGGKYYNGDLTDYYHCGLVDANGNIINLQSSSTGCVISSASQNWSCCGYLKDVTYENAITIPYDMAKNLYLYLKGMFE